MPNCHRTGCSRIRSEFSLFLNRRRAPNFEGRYFCGESCLQIHMERELSERWKRMQQEQHLRVPRPRLGTILIQAAAITRRQLDEALELQSREGQGLLGEWLLRLGFVEEHQITMALARQYGLPLINLRKSDSSSEAIHMVPAKVAKVSRLLPISYDTDRDSLMVAVTGPVDFRCQEAIRRMLRKGVSTYIGDQSAIQALLDQWYSSEDLNGSDNADFSSLDELIVIGRDLLASAIRKKAENIRFELLEDYFWTCLDFGTRSEHQLYLHTPRPAGSKESLEVQALAFASTRAC